MEEFLPLGFSDIEMYAVAVLLLLFVGIVVVSVRRRKAVSDYAADNPFDPDEDIPGLPGLSVIVVAGRGCSNLEACIAAISTQDYPDFEIIVVATESPEEPTTDIIRLCAEYPNVRTTFTPETASGVSVRKLAITLGVKASTRDFVVVTSANCTPQSNYWLKSIGRHFAGYDDIVLATVRPEAAAYTGFGRRYRSYDRVMDTVRYLAAAVHGHPFRGDGRNIAYRKSLFFENKGFHTSLNMKFGDDDIFVSEIVHRGNSAIEVSPESMLTDNGGDYAYRYRLEKMRRYFTLRQSAFGVLWSGKLLSAVYYSYLLATGGVLAYALYLFVDSGNLLKAFILGGFAVALYLASVFTHIAGYRRMAGLLGRKKLFFSVPLFRFVRPFGNGYFASRADRAGNFTWE